MCSLRRRRYVYGQLDSSPVAQLAAGDVGL